MRINVDVTKPLPLVCFLQLKPARDNEPKESRVSYKYEKLSDFCYDCGRIGHEKAVCKFVSREVGERSTYGPEIRTGRPPNLEMTAEQTRWWVDNTQVRVNGLVEEGRRKGILWQPKRGATVNGTRDQVANPSTNRANVGVPSIQVCSSAPSVASEGGEGYMRVVKTVILEGINVDLHDTTHFKSSIELSFNGESRGSGGGDFGSDQWWVLPRNGPRSSMENLHVVLCGVPQLALAERVAMRNKQLKSGMSHSLSTRRDKNLSKIIGFSENDLRFDDRTIESQATLINQGAITQLSEHISTLNDWMDKFTSRIEQLNSKLTISKGVPLMEEVYVSTVHAHNYPVTAFQWHPEEISALRWNHSGEKIP
ncbi:Inorganic pyrophosphatase TTM2 [Camellia lanceoleosa]|uniref:Inorganic pyrophosphatase TTM2 n=1 Tax=Camellia lanceoleosa TaxID=1840588 RepID=A0ACC0HSB7_9ERIC|nr:Inorganic pyrophosphatase TTM2 [Camellia lanceoleosa]